MQSVSQFGQASAHYVFNVTTGENKMKFTYQTPARYAYSQLERNWIDAMIEARNENRAFSWI